MEVRHKDLLNLTILLLEKKLVVTIVYVTTQVIKFVYVVSIGK